VSWQLASFLVLGTVILAGFAWYERSRPPSQVVALVAALAALAIVGRVAFAAFPNVKPTTDVVIFAGYAFGGAPGFAVGALAALVSNFWFGQGPWTPWQMVAWGLCGVLGAALALGGRNAGRLTLAATCGFAGVAYGVLLNFSLMTYGGEVSLPRFLALEAQAIPFDAAHTIGNVVLALVAGPAMVRMLLRFRERFEWRRRPDAPPPSEAGLAPRLRGSGIACLLLAVLVVGLPAPPRAAAAAGPAAAVSWLRSQQNPDGGWGSSPKEKSSLAMTCWAMLGLEAAGENPFDLAAGGKTPVDYLRANAGELKSPGDLARTILALEGAGADPRHFAGENLVAALLGKRRADGSYEDWPNSTAFAVIALRAAGATGSLQSSLEWLRKAQNDDGGWGDVPGSPSTADGTGAVMQALSPGSKTAHRGLSYLREAQRPGGGFPLGGNGIVNTQSSAWAIQGILAVGGDPGSYRRGGKSALDYLASQQAGDGHYRYSKSSDQTPVWVTSDVLVAASGKYFPIAPPPREKPSEPKPKSQSSPSQSTSASPGSSTPAPSTSVPPPASESIPASPSGSTSGSAGSPPERFATPGQAAPGASAGVAPPGGRVREGSGSAETKPPASPSSTEPESDPSGGSSSSSAAGAILTGLLAGCLLFGLGLLGRRGWMRWRYGL
jgi:energy-coupling factor transport system substrate-specific component